MDPRHHARAPQFSLPIRPQGWLVLVGAASLVAAAGLTQVAAPRSAPATGADLSGALATPPCRAPKIDHVDALIVGPVSLPGGVVLKSATMDQFCGVATVVLFNGGEQSVLAEVRVVSQARAAGLTVSPVSGQGTDKLRRRLLKPGQNLSLHTDSRAHLSTDGSLIVAVSDAAGTPIGEGPYVTSVPNQRVHRANEAGAFGY